MNEPAQLNGPAPKDNGYLQVLADHLQDPEGTPLAALSVSVGDADVVQEGTWRWSADVRDRELEAWVRSLRTGDVNTWSRLLTRILSDPAGLTFGAGARLKAMSPFAGRHLVTVTMRQGRSELGGDVSKLFGHAIMAAGHEPAIGAGFLLAIDEGALQGIQAIQTKPGHR